LNAAGNPRVDNLFAVASQLKAWENVSFPGCIALPDRTERLEGLWREGIKKGREIPSAVDQAPRMAKAVGA